MIAQQHDRRPNVMLLRDLQDTLVLEQRAARAAQRTIRSNVNALVLAEVDNLLLRE